MKTQEKIMNVVITILGIVLLGYGIGTPGLFPIQLPLCIIGGFVIGIFLPLSINSFKKEKK